MKKIVLIASILILVCSNVFGASATWQDKLTDKSATATTSWKAPIYTTGSEGYLSIANLLGLKIGTVTNTDLCVGDAGGKIQCTVAPTAYLASTVLDDTKGNGDTAYVWSADKVYDQLALKAASNASTTVNGQTCTLGSTCTVTASLPSNPTACAAGEYVSDIAADGTLTCATPSGSSGDVTGVGDCASGACGDGTSDGGTEIELYSASGNTRIANNAGVTEFQGPAGSGFTGIKTASITVARTDNPQYMDTYEATSDGNNYKRIIAPPKGTGFTGDRTHTQGDYNSSDVLSTAVDATGKIVAAGIASAPKISSTVYAATTSAELAGVLSDENASGGFMTNAMSAAGDMIYGGASGANTRFAVAGQPGYIMTSGTTAGGTVPAWLAPGAAYTVMQGAGVTTTPTFSATPAIGSQTPVIDDPDNFAANFATTNLYGGTFIANAAGTAALPNAGVGMNFTYVLEGANANVIEPLATGTDDTIVLNGVALTQGHNITSSTGGAICYFQYRAANSWMATCNGFVDGT